MVNTSPLISRPRKRRLSIRLSSAEKSSARLAASGAAIKKMKKGLDKRPRARYTLTIEKIKQKHGGIKNDY